MQVRLFGWFAAPPDGEERALGSYKQRALLALLVIHRSEVLPTESASFVLRLRALQEVDGRLMGGPHLPRAASDKVR